jgi:hypothetical protein
VRRVSSGLVGRVCGGKMRVAGLALAQIGGWAGVARADTVIFDNFDDVGAGVGLGGRMATISNGNSWVGPTTNFQGNVTGGLSAKTTAASTASIDLGANYLASNPGIYDLSLDMTETSSAQPGQSWVAMGFMPTNSAGDNLVGNNGAPWLLYRFNGEVVVFGGAGVGQRLTPTSPLISATTGIAHNFKLELDTSKSLWTLNAFVDGAALDLNGALAGDTFTYSSNPTTSRYVGMSTGINGTGTTATVDNFLLTQAVPLPQTAAMALVGFGGLLVSRRRGK